jgi:hypothetical protein
VASDRKITKWFIEYFLWNVDGTPREDPWVREKWRPLLALVGSAFLTWREWVEHHPPEIALIALIHFVFLLIVLAVIVHAARWLSRQGKKVNR